MADLSEIDNNNLNKYLDPKFAASQIDKNDLEKSAHISHHVVSRSDKIHSDKLATSQRSQLYRKLCSDHLQNYSSSNLVSSLLGESDQSSLKTYCENDNSDDNDYKHTGFDNSENDLKSLKELQRKIDWTAKEKRVDVLRELELIINNWSSEHPNISSIFRPEEIDRLLFDSIHQSQHSQYYDTTPGFIQFLIKAGYKDRPVADEGDSKPRSLIRTTPVHRATGHPYTENLVAELFEIYDDPASNYIDAESGLSHFHAACQSPECRNVVEKFLERRSENDPTLPNLAVEKTGDSPLHLALKNGSSEVIELLLRNGAEPNAINKEGLTPLHVICRKNNDELLAQFFKVCDEMQKLEGVKIDALNKSGLSPLHEALANCHIAELPLELLRRGANPQLPTEEGSTALHIICKRDDDYAASMNLSQLLLQILEGGNKKELIDAPDKLNQTPLHYALSNRCNSGKYQIVPFLLRHGADPNKANGQGSTPLHLICQRHDDDDLMDTFLKVCKELDLDVQVDTRDESNRTPLQLAVANLLPKAISALVNHGAKLSDLVFPDYFAKRFEAHPDVTKLNFRINLAVRILSVIDRLERHKFQFDFDSVRIVMDIFIEHNLFNMPEDVDTYLHDSSERRNMTNIKVGSGVSLFDLLHMSQKDAEPIITYLHYSISRRLFGLLSPVLRAVCDAKMCKILMRKYLRGWSSVFPSSDRESIVENPTAKDCLDFYLKITNQSLATITDEEQISTVPKRYHGRIDFKKFSSI